MKNKLKMELELRGNRLILHYDDFRNIKTEIDVTGVWHFFKDYQEFLKHPKEDCSCKHSRGEACSSCPD